MCALQRSPQASVRYVLLTGKPGVGKSTLVKKVCEELIQRGISINGFYTEEIRQGNSRIGFDVVTLNGDRTALARVSTDFGGRMPTVGKYSVHVKSFEEVVIPIFRHTVPNNSVLIIDEIGRMEMLSEMFCREVKSVFTKSCTILATVPNGNNTFVKRLQSLPLAQTFEVDYLNRNTLIEPVLDILFKSTQRM